MNTPQVKIYYDEQGREAEVLMSFETYQALLEQIEDAQDVLAYDEAKREDDGTRLSLEEMKSQLGLG